MAPSELLWKRSFTFWSASFYDICFSHSKNTVARASCGNTDRCSARGRGAKFLCHQVDLYRSKRVCSLKLCDLCEPNTVVLDQIANIVAGAGITALRHPKLHRVHGDHLFGKVMANFDQMQSLPPCHGNPPHVYAKAIVEFSQKHGRGVSDQ